MKPLGGKTWTGCVVKQQVAEVPANFYGMLSYSSESSLKLLVPAAHFHCVKVPRCD